MRSVDNDQRCYVNNYDTKIFLDGFKFTEGLRWHQDKLYFCDLWNHTVYCFNNNGHKELEITLNDAPAGLGWLSNGNLLITSLMDRKLLQYAHDQLSVFKTLDCASPGYCHDFTISSDDIIYLSASGFYPAFNAKPVKSNILMITTKGDINVAASDLGYPNGIVITPDGKNLIVAETFAASIIVFDISADHTLINRRVWAQFDDLGFQVSFDQQGIPIDMKRHYPDGICYDAELNAVWVASPGKKEVLCVNHNNQVLTTVKTQSLPFDCVLGGKHHRTLFIASSDMRQDANTGKIEMFALA